MTIFKNSIFVDLSMIGEVKKFDGMASGTFTDMWGRETVFVPEELPAYVANTKSALESTRDQGGEIVGFPIDAMNHMNGEAAGWIIDVELADGRNVIEFTPRWNAIGQDSIGSDTLRFFSPTIDVNQKVIIGGSLTNWPATRTADHKILLRPVELSAQMQTYQADPPKAFAWLQDFKEEIKSFLSGLIRPENNKGDEPMPEEIETPEVTPEPVELQAPIPAAVDLSSPDVIALINARADEKAAALMAEKEHKAAILALAGELVGVKGLPVDHDRVVAYLSSLPVELYPEGAAILAAATERNPINFGEAGHSRVIQGTQPLPEAIKPALTAWLAGGLSMEKFFEINAVELGSMSDYNLTEFTPKESK